MKTKTIDISFKQSPEAVKTLRRALEWHRDHWLHHVHIYGIEGNEKLVQRAVDLADMLSQLPDDTLLESSED